MESSPERSSLLQLAGDSTVLCLSRGLDLTLLSWGLVVGAASRGLLTGLEPGSDVGTGGGDIVGLDGVRVSCRFRTFSFSFAFDDL